MPDIQQMTSELRGLPDQALQSELQNPTGIVPSYLVLAEAQRRQLMRQAAQKQQSQGQSGSVLDDVVRNMMAQQPPQGLPPAPAGMTPPRQGPAPMPGAAPPSQMQMARGGAIRLADGGDPDDDDEDQPQVDQPQVQAQGEAGRAATQPVNLDDLAEAMIQFEGSRLPTSPGFHANNPGHLMDAGQVGSIGKDAAGFARFKDWNTGLAAMKNQIRLNLKRGLTLSEMIGGKKGVYPGWAPAYSNGKRINNTENYIKYITQKTGYNPALLMEEGGKPAPANAPIRQPVLAAPPSVSTPSLQGPNTSTDTGAPAATDPGTDTPDENPVPKAPPPQAEEEGDGNDGDPEEDLNALNTGPAEAPAEPAKTSQPSFVMQSPQPFDPYSPANIEKTRNLYGTLFGSPEGQRQLDATRAATVQQLTALQQDAINRYRNPNPWEFLSNIAAGMGGSHQLSLPLMFGEGVGRAWQARDQQQDKALSEAEQLQTHIDSIQNTGQSERERQGRDMITMLGQQAKNPQVGRQTFEKFLQMGAPYGVMDPAQAPGPGMIGVPDPDRPGYGLWVPQNQSLKQASTQKPTGMFEKDFLPGWAEDNNTTPDKMTGAQRRQAFMDYRASLADPNIKEAAQEIAQGIMDGTQPPDMKGLYRYGGQVRAILAKQGYNLTTSMRDWQNLQKYYGTLNGAAQLRLRQSTEFVSETLPYVRKLYQDWQSTGLPTGFKEYNKAALIAAANLPGEQGTKAQLLLAQINDLTSELGTMYKGGNQSTDESLRLAGENLKAEWNPKTFMAALGQLENNVKIRKNSMANIAPVGVSPNSPYAVKPGGGGGFSTAGPTGGATGGPPPGALDNLQPGQIRTFKNGQRWRKRPDGTPEQVQ